MSYHISFETVDGYAVTINKDHTVVVSDEVEFVQNTGEFGFYRFPGYMAKFWIILNL